MNFKTFKNIPSISFYPEVIDKINLIAKESDEKIYFIGRVMADSAIGFENTDLIVNDIELIKQSVTYSKSEIDKVEFVEYTQRKEFLEKNAIIYPNIIGKTRCTLSSVPTEEEIEYIIDNFSFLGYLIYVSINGKLEMNVSYFDFANNFYVENCKYEIDCSDTTSYTKIDFKKDYDDLIEKGTTVYNSAKSSTKGFNYDNEKTPSELASCLPNINEVV